jgi:predicted DNA-binding transcriptional regulator YafY
VQIAYETRHTSAAIRHNEREVDPYALTYIRTAWYLIGYCHLRQDLRYFRLDRIDQLTVLKVGFERPADFRPEVKEAEPRHILVEVLFTHEVKRWVREDPGFYTARMDDHPDGLLVTLHVQREQDILLWLLGWGRQVRVLSPPSLQRLLVDEAEAIAAHYKTAETLLP